MLRDKEGPWSTHTHAPLHGLELQMRVFGAEGHVTMALIDARREGRSFLFFILFSIFFLFFGAEGGRRDEANERARTAVFAKENDRAPARCARLSRPSLRKSIISFMPFPFIHQPGPA